ncbi:ribosome maturation factor RimM [Microlunatus sp. Y2014]|uniref:ribosome maturation factor RimM n=1 Tax=Microlunatus sp. Y2014 TaxID=3418488 RepID=UPI003DA70C4C
MGRTVEVVVGVVGRAHGIRGELGIDVRTDEPEVRFRAGTRLHAEGEPHRSWQIAGSRWHGEKLLVRLTEVSDRTGAEALRGVRLATSVPAGASPEDKDAYYDHQLVGLRVLDHDRRGVGRITEVQHGRGQDLLVIELDDADPAAEPRLVPFVAALVPAVDLAAGTVQLADLPGLLADQEE